ncbi:MAG: hypothetical protein B7Z80_07050 [Rhodospirillales bacterium 20-64-7]|nr:MAG: hypothetical protein B7Z80_07050 [Rhodospirillales bacterium 20-64-7]
MAAPDEDEFIYRTRRGRPGMDPAMRRMAFGAGGVAVLVIGVALLWSGVRATGFGPPPVIEPPPGPLRTLPIHPGGLTVPEANQQIMSGQRFSAPPQLAPPPPAPAIDQLDRAAGITPPPPPDVSGLPFPPPLPGQPAAPAQSNQPAAPAQSNQPAAPAQSNQPAAPALTAAAAPAVSAAPAPAMVQLAVTPDETGAQQVWTHLQARLPSLFANKSPDIVPAVVNGHSQWRLRLGGFSSAADAQDFCNKVLQKGAACRVAGS